MGKIALLCATTLEQEALRRAMGPKAETLRWVISGMGAGPTAYATLKTIQAQRSAGVVPTNCSTSEITPPPLLIQVGIAGAFPASGLALETVVLVERDYQADLGAWRSESQQFQPFTEIGSPTLPCPWIETFGLSALFPVVGGRSVNTACAPWPPRSGDAVESMEGASFFDICTAEKVPFLQLRAISNHVGQPRAEWRVPQALEALATALERLLAALP